MSAVTVRQEFERVQVIAENRVVLDMPWQAALDFVRGCRRQAKRAEEYDKAEQIIDDGAMLLRAGSPIGLTDNPVMKNEIIKEAVSNTRLRRNMRPLQGVASQECPGIPTIIRESDVQALPPEERIKYLQDKYPDLIITRRR